MRTDFDYIDVLARLHETRRPRTYLEIGVYRGESLRLAGHDTFTVGVDPEPDLSREEAARLHVVSTTSDEFFAGPLPTELLAGRPVDLAFIDGEHLFEYALRDFMHIESLAGNNSLVVAHDCLPRSDTAASRKRSTLDWSGDVWKLVLCLLEHRPDLKLRILDVPPSGLLLVSDLDPSSRKLPDAYETLVARYVDLPFAAWQARLADVLRRTAPDTGTLLWMRQTEASRLRAVVDEMRTDMTNLQDALAEAQLEQTESEAKLAAAESLLAQLRSDTARLQSALDNERARLTVLANSTSWRVTAPGRHAGRLLRDARSEARHKAGDVARVVAPAYMERRRTRWAALRESVTADGPVPVPDDSSDDPLMQAAEAAALAYRPLISVLVPVYNTPPQYLRLAVESVLAQVYPEWELCLCDDGSRDQSTREALERLPRLDERIAVTFLAENQGIARASNAALAMARGEFVAMLDHDDELLPAALLEVAKTLNADPTLDVVYTDQDYVEADGRLAQRFHKPDWSLEMFRGVMYVGHLLVVRRSLAEQVGGFDPTFDNVQDFEFMLRLAEHTERIAHVPKVLYHWRKIPGSVAFGGDEKHGIEPRQAAAVNAHFARCGVPAIAHSNPDLAHRLLIYPAPDPQPTRVTVVVDATGAEAYVQQCVADLVARRNGADVEIVVIGGDLGAVAIAHLRAAGATLVAPSQQSAVAMGEGVARSTGELIVAMAADLTIESAGWLDHLVFDCGLPGVACVAPLVLGPDGEVDCAGLAVDAAELLIPEMRGWPVTSDGYAGSLSCTREVSVVPGSCYAISRAVLAGLGGLDPNFSSVWYQAADLSLRARSRGLRNLCTPRVVVRRRQPATADRVRDGLDRLLLLDAWQALVERGDPYFGPQLIAATRR